jgi:hypothetical protein
MIRSRNRALIALCLALLGTGCTLNAQEPESKFQAEFDDAVESLRATITLHPRKWRQIGSSNKRPDQITGWSIEGELGREPFGLDPFLPTALALAKAHGSSAIPELRRRLDMANGHARVLALMTLAALADHPAAAEALTRAVINGEYADPSAFLAATYAPEPVARAIGLKGFRLRPKGSYEHRRYLELLRIFGDESSVREIEKRIANVIAESPGAHRDDPHTPIHSGSSLRQLARLHANLAVLREKLKQPGDLRTGWAAQDAALLQVLFTGSKSISQEIAVNSEAARLVKARKFTAPYLAGRLMAMTELNMNSSNLLNNENDYVFIIINQQLPPAVILALEQVAIRSIDNWHKAVNTLARFGTRDALSRIEHLIKPPTLGIPDDEKAEKANWPRRTRKRVNLFCSGTLAHYGDGESLKVLESVADDPAYPADEREQLAKARDSLRKQLNEQVGPPRPN